MKKKVSLIVAIIFLLMSGCSHSIYSHGKPFKPDRHNQIHRCQTYDDVIYRR